MSMFGSYPLSRLGTGSALASSLTSVSSVTARGSSVASSSSAKTNAEALAEKDRAKHGGKAGEHKGDVAAGSAGGADKAGAEAEAKDRAGSAGEVVAEVAASAGNTVAQLAKGSASALGSLFSSETQFRFSTLLAVAVTAFLLGSLMRSTLAPLDFVLVSTKQKPFAAGSYSTVAEGERARSTIGKLTGKLGGGHPTAASAKKDFMELVNKVQASSGGDAIGELRNELGGGSMVKPVQWTELQRWIQLPFPGAGWDVVVGGVRRR